MDADGRTRSLGRVAGQYSNVSIFDVADQDELHAVLSMVTPLDRHL
jgi:muconolactone D-isomerase